MSIIAYVQLAIPAGGTATQSFPLATYAISQLQPRGKCPVIEVVTLPDTWTACAIRFVISGGALLSDWRGVVACATEPGDTIVGPPGVWVGVQSFAIICDRPQEQDVEIGVGVGGIDDPRIDRLSDLAMEVNAALAELAGPVAPTQRRF